MANASMQELRGARRLLERAAGAGGGGAADVSELELALGAAGDESPAGDALGGPLTEHEVRLAAVEGGRYWKEGVIPSGPAKGQPIGNIDVNAQRALVRMSQRRESAPAARAILDAIVDRTLRGIFGEHQRTAALRARAWGKGYWEVVPKGEDAVVLLDEADPPGGAPLILFRESARADAARLDAALERAGKAFLEVVEARREGRLEVADEHMAAGADARRCRVEPVVPRVSVCARPRLPRTAPVQISVVAIRSGGGPAPRCMFTVTHARDTQGRERQGASGEQARFLVPRGHVRALVVPEGRELWAVAVRLEVSEGAVHLAPESATEVTGQVSAQGLRVTVVLSRLRDVTEKMKKLAGNWSARVPGTPRVHFIAPEVLRGGRLQLEVARVRPATVEEVWELRGVAAPRLLAVSWPVRRVLPAAGPSPMPLLVYFPAEETISADEPGDEARARQRLHEGFVDYLRFGGSGDAVIDPLRDGGSGRKGLPYQVARSRRQVAIVLPLPAGSGRFNVGYGEFGKGEAVADVLGDLQDMMGRRELARAGRGVTAFPPLPLGPVALAGWSLGNTAVATLLHERSAFVRDAVKEVYAFGPARLPARRFQTEEWAVVAARWKGSDTSKVIRIYGDKPPEARERISAPNGETLGFRLGYRVWRAAGSRRHTSAHSLNAAFLLTDALRRSRNF